MRLQAMLVPDPPDGCLADSNSLGHAASAPVGRIAGQLLGCLADNFQHHLLGEAGMAPWTRGILLNAGEPKADKTIAPPSDGEPVGPDGRCNVAVLPSCRRKEHNPSPQHEPSWCATTTLVSFELPSFLVRERNRGRYSHGSILPGSYTSDAPIRYHICDALH